MSKPGEVPGTETFDLQLMIAAGPEDLQRATLGLAAALAAVSGGKSVLVFFAMRGALWTAPGELSQDEVTGFPSIGELRRLLLELGAEMQGCTSCVDTHLLSALDEAGHRTMEAGFSHGGLASVALRMQAIPTTIF